MKQHLFEEQYHPVWRELEGTLGELESKGKSSLDRRQLQQFIRDYRQTCYHYSIARTRQYSPQLVTRLHDLVLRAHQHLYSGKRLVGWRIIQFVMVDFPAAVRANSRFLWLSTALLVLPGIIIGLLCFYNGQVVYSVLSEDEVFGFEMMYSPDAQVLGRSRESATDFLMFGYYIKHNIGIGFRTFAGGLLLGIGTVITLLFNGTYLGAVAGYLTQLGYTQTFWPFVAGHGAFELTAICISGAAGLRLAYPLFAPGRLRRIDALRLSAREAVILVIGAAFMLVAAAFIEAFWSSNRAFDPAVKYTVAAMLWLLVVSYLTFTGRSHAD
ncbi:MAG: stage II sporulation protein M [Gammaproteobacteria bacterium]|jgi:uncharacterized membrane protein SpoIIM required for sporulation